MQITLNDTGSGELYLKIMKAICGDISDKSMADLMCHHSPYNSRLGFKERVYVDILDRGLDDESEQRCFVKSDVFSFLETLNHVDCIICSDGIEHLDKDKGFELVMLIRDKSSKSIFFTPLGEYMVGVGDMSHPDTHNSGYTPNDFEGYASIVLPNFHPLLNCGAFFSWTCDNIKEDFERVKKELL